jgi:hypothetical protein
MALIARKEQAGWGKVIHPKLSDILVAIALMPPLFFEVYG